VKSHVLKFDTRGALWVCRGREMAEIHLPWNKRWQPNFKWLFRYNSAADCPIALKIWGMLVHYGSAKVAEALSL